MSDGEEGEEGANGGEQAGAEGDKDKKKTTRGSRACLVCRRLKVSLTSVAVIGADGGPSLGPEADLETESCR